MRKVVMQKEKSVNKKKSSLTKVIPNIQSVFSVTNSGIRKIITIFGVKIKIKSKKLIEQKKWKNLENRLNKQLKKYNKNLTAQKKEYLSSYKKLEAIMSSTNHDIMAIKNIIINNLKLYILKENINDIPITTFNNNQNIYTTLKDLEHFYFLPNKGNLGDIVIASSEFQYFDANNFNYEVYDIFSKGKYDLPYNLVYGGGGIWNKLYQNYYKNILEVFKSKLLKKCIILPSSFYDCEDVINILDERFTVFCREKQSYEYCKSLNQKANFILADDMAIGTDFNMHNKAFYNEKNAISFINSLDTDKMSQYISLYNRYQKEKLKILEQLREIEDFTVGYLLRQDREKNIQLQTSLKSIDLSSVLGGYACDKSYAYICSKFFLEVIDKFDIIVTDRLHVGICATKLGKQVFLLDNTYKKISEVYKYSLYKYPNSHLSTPETLDNDIEKIKQEPVTHTQNNDFSVKSFEDFMLQYGSFNNEYGIEKSFPR